jgi:hypothetical protein
MSSQKEHEDLIDLQYENCFNAGNDWNSEQAEKKDDFHSTPWENMNC